jgi:hypothetical protein
MNHVFITASLGSVLKLSEEFIIKVSSLNKLLVLLQGVSQ